MEYFEEDIISNSIQSDITIQEINSLDQIVQVNNSWDFLHNTFDNKNIYSDREFFISMFNFRAPESAKPNIILFKKNGNPIAIIIGWETANYIVTSWIGYIKLRSPHLKCFEIEINGLITDGTSESEKIIYEYLKSLIKKKKVDLFAFDHLTARNPLWEGLLNGEGVQKKSVYKNSVEWVTTLRDSKTGDKIRVHSQKTSSKLKRKARKFERAYNNELQIKFFNKTEEVDFFIKKAETISKNSYQYSINVGIADNKYWNSMLRAMTDGKYFRGYMLMNNEKPIAYIFGVKYSNILYLIGTSYDHSFSQYSPGEYLRHQLIEKFMVQGIDIIDYGFGDAVYKQRCGTEYIEEASIRIYGNSIKALYSSLIDRFTTKVISKLLEILKNFGLLDKIKLLWRQRLLKRTAVF